MLISVLVVMKESLDEYTFQSDNENVVSVSYGGECSPPPEETTPIPPSTTTKAPTTTSTLSPPPVTTTMAETTGCPEGQYPCPSDGSCKVESTRCDGFEDCPNGEDEEDCSYAEDYEYPDTNGNLSNKCTCIQSYPDQSFCTATTLAN